jgi:hypothetical protein
MADLAPDRTVGTPRDPSKTEQAAELIRGALADGEWHLAAAIRAQLAEMNLDSGSVRGRALTLAGVEKRKRPGADGPWEWHLREGSTERGPFAAARARSLTDDGPFDSIGDNPSSNGKGPRDHTPSPNREGDGEGTTPDEPRAREDGALVTALRAEREARR